MPRPAQWGAPVGGDEVEYGKREEKVKVTCVVDNTVGWGTALWGEHGLSFLIETEEGGRVLFDTGQSGTVLLHNLTELKVHPQEISTLALSHAHQDHTGGLEAFLERGSGLTLYAHPDIFRQRFSRHNGERRSIGLPLPRGRLAARAELRLSAEPVEIAPGVWITGEITSRPEPEGRSDRHLVREEDGWASDPYRDDLSLVLQVGGGLVLLCGCCHAGLLNTLLHVRRTFEGEIVAVAGGTHLVDAKEDYLEHVVAVLREEFGPPQLYLNHCTGEQAYLTLVSALGERVHSCPAGTVLEF